MPSKEREELQRLIAGILDHPSVYMGGPSRQNMRRADQILSTIRAALQEPTEGMRHSAYIFQDDLALHDGDVPTFDDYWRIGLAASALGEQGE